MDRRLQRLAFKMEFSASERREIRMTMVVKARLRDIAAHFGLSSEMTKEATLLLEEAFKEIPSFVLFAEEEKIIVAGCCVYVVSRRHDGPMPATFVANFVDAPTNVFFNILKQLNEGIHIDFKSIDLDVMVGCYLNELGSLGADEINKMIVTVNGLVDICKKTLIVEGVHAQPFLAAASYVAWCCLTFPPREGHKGSFSAFCKTTGAECKGTSRLRLRELLTLLAELAGEIPSLAGQQISKKDVLSHLKTILKHRETLIKSREANVEKPNLFYGIFDRRPKKNATPMEATCTSTRGDEEIGGDDLDVIPEEEMANYIRSPEEVEYILKLQAKNNGK